MLRRPWVRANRQANPIGFARSEGKRRQGNTQSGRGRSCGNLFAIQRLLPQTLRGRSLWLTREIHLNTRLSKPSWPYVLRNRRNPGDRSRDDACFGPAAIDYCWSLTGLGCASDSGGAGPVTGNLMFQKPADCSRATKAFARSVRAAM
jgi:hypothetical protein